MNTATIDAPFKVQATPQLVISLPSWKNRKRFRRNKSAFVTEPPTGIIPRIRHKMRLTAKSIAAIFMKVTEKVWSYKAVRFVTYVIAAVSALTVASFFIALAAVLLAFPFWAMELMLVGDLVYYSATIVLWYVGIYYTTGFAIEQGWLG